MLLDNQPEEAIILTLDKTVIKARKASQPTARITILNCGLLLSPTDLNNMDSARQPNK